MGFEMSTVNLPTLGITFESYALFRDEGFVENIEEHAKRI